MHKFFIGALTALCLSLPLAAQAQNVPSYATPQNSTDQNIHGRIANFDGGYALNVRDERGYIDAVRLHPGTIINPRGLMLEPGMVVSILGYYAANYFSANEIDTPYGFYRGSAYYARHPWNYYGPTVSLGFFFGNPGWWHRSYFATGFRYNGGVRVYNHARVTEIYRRPGGRYAGRDFVAPRERGGYYARADRDGDHRLH